MAPSESVLTGFDCTYNNLLGSDPSYTHVGNLHRGGGPVERGAGGGGISDHRKICVCYHEIRCASFFSEENYIANILHFYSVHRKKTYLL